MKKLLLFCLCLTMCATLCDLRTASGAILPMYQKNPTTWQVNPDGPRDVLLYYESVPDSWFEYQFDGYDLQENTSYTLLYFPDPWPGNGLFIIDAGTTDGEGYLHLAGAVDVGAMPYTSDDNNAAGAKIWLAPSNHVDAVNHKMLIYSPTTALYEYEKIRFPFQNNENLGIIDGSVVNECAGMTVDLFDQWDHLLHYEMTDAAGLFGFTIVSGAFEAQLIVPLGFEVTSDNPADATVALGQTTPVSFTLNALVTCNEARSKGYWKHQLKGKGNVDYTTAELEEFCTFIYDHFYDYYNADYQICIDGVTYSPANDYLTVDELDYWLKINQGGSTMGDRARQQLLTAMLNIASNKLGQCCQIAEDGASMSQFLLWAEDVLVNTGGDEELIKDCAEAINHGTLICAGVIPQTYPVIIYSEVVQAISIVRDCSQFSAAPNPFNPETRIRFELQDAAHVSLRIVDVAGRQMATLVDGWRNGGEQEALFDASKLSSGIYFARLEAGNRVSCMKLLLLK